MNANMALMAFCVQQSYENTPANLIVTVTADWIIQTVFVVCNTCVCLLLPAGR